MAKSFDQMFKITRYIAYGHVVPSFPRLLLSLSLHVRRAYIQFFLFVLLVLVLLRWTIAQ